MNGNLNISLVISTFSVISVNIWCTERFSFCARQYVYLFVWYLGLMNGDYRCRQRLGALKFDDDCKWESLRGHLIRALGSRSDSFLSQNRVLLASSRPTETLHVAHQWFSSPHFMVGRGLLLLLLFLPLRLSSLLLVKDSRTPLHPSSQLLMSWCNSISCSFNFSTYIFSHFSILLHKISCSFLSW